MTPVSMSRCSVEPQVQVNSAKALIPQFPHTCEWAPNFRCPSFAFIFQFDKGSLKKETFCRFTINNAESKTANWVNTTQNTHFLCAVFVQRRSNIKLTYKTDISSVTQRYNDNDQKYICLIGSSHTYELPQTKDSWLLRGELTCRMQLKLTKINKRIILKWSCALNNETIWPINHFIVMLSIVTPIYPNNMPPAFVQQCFPQ